MQVDLKNILYGNFVNIQNIIFNHLKNIFNIINNIRHSPGPNSYNDEILHNRGPAYTIGSKHKHLEIPTHPVGPNQYNLPNTIGNVNVSTRIKTAPKFTISCKIIFFIYLAKVNLYYSFFLLNSKK